MDKLPPTLFFSGSWKSSTTPLVSEDSNFQQAQTLVAGESEMLIFPFQAGAMSGLFPLIRERAVAFYFLIR